MTQTLKRFYKKYPTTVLSSAANLIVSILFPKLSPFIGLCYHFKELTNVIDYYATITYDYNDEVLGTITFSHNGINMCLSIEQHLFGLIVGVVELGLLTEYTDSYVKNSLIACHKLNEDNELLYFYKLCSFMFDVVNYFMPEEVEYIITGQKYHDYTDNEFY